LEHYKLHKESKIVFLDDNDQARNEALDFTMKTDDGQSPYLLFQADLVLLGVSRAGKTPVSLIL
jgi:regulator of PEP synthase PpsR (kinase-PPPase family)